MSRLRSRRAVPLALLACAALPARYALAQPASASSVTPSNRHVTVSLVSETDAVVPGRPLTLGIRLFANMYAGHIMLGVFALFCAIVLERFTAVGVIVLPLSFVMEVVLRAFEVFVAVLQAYIFTMLTAVYINGALHATEH